MKESDIKKLVRENYGAIAHQGASCCGPGSCCCSGSSTADVISGNIGYSDDDIRSVPEGANLGLGCGNPVALASLKTGETVLDLGSGAGFDCFIASAKVGETGKVIGVDMTPDMLDRARANALKGGYKNVEFRLGEIEHIPAADGSIDAVISNCVINLSTDKPQVFREAYRVLRSGGRIMISDIVLLDDLPQNIMESVAAYVGCIAGASLKDDYIMAIRDAGFKNIDIVSEKGFAPESMYDDQDGQTDMRSSTLSAKNREKIVDSVRSISVRAVK
jgi:SAM-dependent methyltransferase